MLGLQPQVNGSIFDSTGGTLTWITAGRYVGHLSAPSMPHPDDNDVTGHIAFNDLVTTVRSRGRARQDDVKLSSKSTLCIFRGGWSKVNY